MIHSNLQYKYILLIILIKINYLSGQIYPTNDILDFFYNIDFTGPVFDQPVYTKLNFLISNPLNTPIFNFTVKPQPIYTGLNFDPSIECSYTLATTSDDITVTSDDPSFIVVKSDNFYTLVTNIFPLNYFLPSHRYSFELIAKQTFSRRPPITSTARVQIYLINDNAHAPMFIDDNHLIFYIRETVPVKTIFGTVNAIDLDNDRITYSMPTGYPQFSINSTTGVLTLEREFDSSSSSLEYNISVKAIDDGSSCSTLNPSCTKRFNSTIIRIVVTTVNKHSPEFLNELCGQTVSFNENSPNGTTIVKIHGFDNDRGDDGLIDISFASVESHRTLNDVQNAAYSQFYIEQLNQTGKVRTALLKTNGIFDYDAPGATRVWHLWMIVKDRGTPTRQSYCSLRIELRNINDNPPVFLMTNWNYTIYRSTINTTDSSVFRIIASDLDTYSTDGITYYISTPSVPYFTISSTTGIITCRISSFNQCNYSTNLFPITFHVYAQDNGTPPLFDQSNTTVTIYYDNSTSISPAKWLNTSYETLNLSIIESYYNMYPNQLVYDNGFNGSLFFETTSSTSPTITITSPFLPGESLPFSLSLPRKDGTIFNTGIYVTKPLDAEYQNIYLLFIHVLVNPPLISTVTVRIKDENDQTSQFTITSMQLSVTKKENGQRKIAQIQAFDRDVDPQNNYIVYCLDKSSSDNGSDQYFGIEPNGTLWTNITSDAETSQPSYQLVIRASNSTETLCNSTSELQINVQVIDFNDIGPDINRSCEENIFIDEITNIGSSICNFTINDTDINTNLSLGILSGNIGNAFTFSLLSIDNSTGTHIQAIGQLKVVRPLDYQAITNYTLVLFAFNTKHFSVINVTVYINPNNTRAPYFNLLPGFTFYQYRITENTPYSSLHEPIIQAFDPDSTDSSSSLHFENYTNYVQYNLTNFVFNVTRNTVEISIKDPGFSRDLPFGSPIYSFTIKVTDENGTGLSTYVPVFITVTDINNKAQIPTNFPCIQPGFNSSIPVQFEDYDDSTQNNTIPCGIKIINSSNFILNPTISSNGYYNLTYIGLLNRTLTKNLTVTFNASDCRDNVYQLSTISIVVCDELNQSPILDASKTVKIIYVNGYENSLRNINLGSVFVQDTNDWYRSDRSYSILSVSNGHNFNVSQGLLSTSDRLSPGFYTIRVGVTKPNVPSSAISTINLEVQNIDSEYIRQATTIRIKGKFPETLIDPTFDYLNKIRQALASILSVNIDSIIIFAIRPVCQYYTLLQPPKSFEMKEHDTLTDVIFYSFSCNQVIVEHILNNNLMKFKTDFQIEVIAIGASIYSGSYCPRGTIPRLTRTIQPKPYAIDTNLTSFVGINILDSPDCINSSYSIDSPNNPTGSLINARSDCASISSSYGNSFGPNGEVLGLQFNENGQGYAMYDGRTFSNLAPTRFSFEFLVPSPIRDGLILLYGKNTTSINEFFWIAIEILESKLKFHFRDTILNVNESIDPSTWYYVECQFIETTILISLNDYQYLLTITDTSTSTDLSTVQLYLGGLPTSNTLISALYPALTRIDTFNGCIRNVLSNGIYLNMSDSLSLVNAYPGDCFREIDTSGIIVPWYTWLIIILILLFLITIIIIVITTFRRSNQELKALTGLYINKTMDNLMIYKESAGEEDHSTYNLGILKKRVQILTDNSNDQTDYYQSESDPRPSLGNYIEKKLKEQVLSYADDTLLHYKNEGEGSILSNLSSIESSSSNENLHQFLSTLGPKFSNLTYLYTDDTDNNNTY